jgi:aspartate aminotransferase-like enzyme
MSNYPNMSYVMNENTLLALRQVLDAMQEEGLEFLRDMTREERRAWNELYNACESFLNLSDDLAEEEQREPEHDGQPDEAQEWYDFDPEC